MRTMKLFFMKDSARKLNKMSWLKAPDEFKREDFTAVATINTDSLEDAFRLTNHIENSWCSNPEVTMLVGTPIRSCSVGDLFEVDGKGYIVDGCGFKEVY